jgi:hypothetical protein
MGSYRSDLKQKLGGNNSINHPPLQAQAGGAVAFPLTRQGFIMKPFYQT